MESSEEYDTDDLPTKEELETAYFTTIEEFSTYVASITKDLEETEIDTIKKAFENGDDFGERLWEDATFKINFTKKIIFGLFKPDRLIKYHIALLHPMKPWLDARDIDFFIKNDHIYPGAPEADIKFFKDLWRIDGTMTDDEKNTIWEFFDTLIEIAEDWQDVTGWVRTKEDDLDIPEVDYTKADKYARGEQVDFGERVVYMPTDGSTSYIAKAKQKDANNNGK